MEISTINNSPHFGNLYQSDKILKKLCEQNRDEKFFKDYRIIDKYIRISGYDSCKNLDIIIDINENIKDKLVAIVLPKTKKTLTSTPRTMMLIDKKPERLTAFGDLIEKWKYLLSSK